jgi:hypothetical protein
MRNTHMKSLSPTIQNRQIDRPKTICPLPVFRYGDINIKQIQFLSKKKKKTSSRVGENKCMDVWLTTMDPCLFFWYCAAALWINIKSALACGSFRCFFRTMNYGNKNHTESIKRMTCNRHTYDIKTILMTTDYLQIFLIFYVDLQFIKAQSHCPKVA